MVKSNPQAPYSIGACDGFRGEKARLPAIFRLAMRGRGSSERAIEPNRARTTKSRAVFDAVGEWESVFVPNKLKAAYLLRWAIFVAVVVPYLCVMTPVVAEKAMQNDIIFKKRHLVLVPVHSSGLPDPCEIFLRYFADIVVPRPVGDCSYSAFQSTKDKKIYYTIWYKDEKSDAENYDGYTPTYGFYLSPFQSHDQVFDIFIFRRMRKDQFALIVNASETSKNDLR